jgi:hypothetical protein
MRSAPRSVRRQWWLPNEEEAAATAAHRIAEQHTQISPIRSQHKEQQWEHEEEGSGSGDPGACAPDRERTVSPRAVGKATSHTYRCRHQRKGEQCEDERISDGRESEV